MADTRFTKDERKRLATLRRRLEHLDHRIAHYRGRDPSHDKAEAAAIRWALSILEESDHGAPLAQGIQARRPMQMEEIEP